MLESVTHRQSPVAGSVQTQDLAKCKLMFAYAMIRQRVRLYTCWPAEKNCNEITVVHRLVGARVVSEKEAFLPVSTST